MKFLQKQVKGPGKKAFGDSLSVLNNPEIQIQRDSSLKSGKLQSKCLRAHQKYIIPITFGK